ncbi:UNVERIFIED_CONTAM: hypothetical protein GTU68_061627, partial [Idotea baltica]|nr:hypothetical protein [Idotea baltica]
DKEIAAQIVGNLDRDGFLDITPLELSQSLRISLEIVENVRAEVQSLDPLGVASLNMTENLLFQLEMKGYSNSLASILVKKYLDVLANGNVDKIYKEEGVSLEDIREALVIIKSMTPFPGRMFSEEAPRYIEPDVYVVKSAGQYQVSLNTDGLPELALNDEYLALLESAEKGSPQALFLAEKLKSANFLIRSVEQRKRTIQKVMKSILKYQYDFFIDGPSALKPLVLKDVAADIGMHESTISRVTSNKYVHTDRGVFELKYFFSSSIKSSTGDLASEAVKVRLTELIAAEDSKKPLSDQELSNSLAKEGIKVARRTVAKYRESLQILSARKRKDSILL